jgi:tetratricopeptide (TPR) repeat protein
MKKHLNMIPALLLIVFLLTGCATTVAFDVLKPAEVNMADYKKLAIYDFEPYDLDDAYFTNKFIIEYLLGEKQISTTGYRIYIDDEIAEYMTDQTIETLERTNYFDLVASEKMRDYLGYGRNTVVSNRMLSETLGVDAVLIGEIQDMDYDERIDEKEKMVWIEPTEEVEGHYETVIDAYFVQNVELRAYYNVIDVDTGNIIASKHLTGRDSNRTLIKDPDTFSAPLLEPMYRSIIRGFQDEIKRHLAPYYVREYRSMMKEKDNPRFETAEQYIKSSQYKQALDLYTTMWYDSGSFAAGYNAAILYEVMGQYDSALALMKEVYDATRNPDAYEAYQRLQRVKIEAEEASKQF